VCATICRLKALIYTIRHALKMSTLTIYDRTIVIRKLNGEVIIDFAIILTRTVSPTTRTLNRNRIFSFHPIGNIDIMHMLFDDMVTTKPVEIKPISHLVFHLSLLRFTWANPYPPAVPINLSGNYIADSTILYALDSFSVVRLVATL